MRKITQLNKEDELDEIKIFLSIVLITKNDSYQLSDIIQRTEEVASRLVSDYEIIVVDNGSTDSTSSMLRKLTSEKGVPNLQTYSLASSVSELVARWVGVENSLGDIAVIMDPRQGDLEQLELMLRKIESGNDIVFSTRTYRKGHRYLPKTIIYLVFSFAIKLLAGIDLGSYSTSLLAINRRVVNYLLQFPDPHIKFRNLPSTAGFKRTSIKVPLLSKKANTIKLRESLLRGIQLITSSSYGPLRLATTMSAFGAFLSFSYSLYVVFIWAFKNNIAPGWVSISMQQSGMFFLISLVLLVLSEYVLEISRKAGSGPTYYICDELTSAKMTRKERLNVEVDLINTSKSKKSLFDQ